MTTLDYTKGKHLLLADEWVKVRAQPKRKIWRAPYFGKKIQRLSRKDAAWLTQVVSSPGILRHSKAGRLENLIQIYSSEVFALLAWADEKMRKSTYRRGVRTRGPEVVALRLTTLAGMKEYEAAAKGGANPVTESEVKNADKVIRKAVRKAKSHTDA